MAFDFSGVMVLRQWRAFKTFFETAISEAQDLMDHLEFEVEIQEDFHSKLVLADASIGGTSIAGFLGQNYSPVDLRDAKIGQQTQNGSEDENLVNFLHSRRLDRSSLVPAVTAENACGGDLPWMDTPQIPQTINPAGAWDDHHTFVYMDFLKKSVLPQIQSMRERLETRLKVNLDYREQILIQIYRLRQSERLSDLYIREIETMFRTTDRGDEVGDPDAKPFTPDNLKDQETVSQAVDRSALGTLYRNLWEDYPPTRLLPVWPALPPIERGNAADYGDDFEPLDVELA